MALADDDEMTELVDADFPRVDLVGKGANGIPRFLIAKQDEGSRGLVPAELVRELIAKAEPDPEPTPADNGQVTMTGSPAAIAAFIHKAGASSVPAADGWDYATVCKEKYSAADRKKMAGSGAAMAGGSYPIADEEDLHRAIRAVGRGGSSHNAIRKHVISRARSLGKSSLIPDNWNSDGSLKEPVSKEDAVTGAVAKADLGPELDGGTDGMDPTVALAEPDKMGPGDMTDPGSPAWESIDAATAAKWCSILSRARVAVDLLAEREMLEAASADPDDACNAMDLQDACCAIDYAISVLAPFAVAEQSEADCGEADMMAAIGKAAESLEAVPLGTVEGLCAVAKSGRVLSAANESHIREAAARLTTVLQSLPQAPSADDGQPVAKEKEAAMTATATEPETVAKETASPDEQVPAGEVLKSALALVYDRDGTLAGVANADAIVQRVAKADASEGKVTMQAVFDENGNLVGIVDPADITPVAGAGGKPDAADDGAADAAPAADASDMTPSLPQTREPRPVPLMMTARSPRAVTRTCSRCWRASSPRQWRQRLTGTWQRTSPSRLMSPGSPRRSRR